MTSCNIFTYGENIFFGLVVALYITTESLSGRNNVYLQFHFSLKALCEA